MNPMLQLGGVQVAMIEAPPPAVCAVAVMPTLVPVAQFVPPTPIESGLDEHQVKKLPLMGTPRVSVTVAVMVWEPALGTVTVLLPALSTVRVIDCTAQVVKVNGVLVVPSTLAKMVVVPGTLAVACVCPGSIPLMGATAVAVLSVTTLALTACQVTAPTVEVMSAPWLKTVAW